MYPLTGSEHGMFSGGSYCSIRCPDVVTMMTLIRVVNTPPKHNECSSPFLLFSVLKSNVLTLSYQSEVDSTRGDGCVNSQILQTLLTSIMTSRPGTVFFVPWMKLVN